MAEPNGRAALSRRGFIMGAASAGALSAIGGLLGCAPKEQAPAQAGAQAADGADPAAAGWLGQEPDIPESDIAKTLETEVLVVGGGTSGLFAAASAAENGAKTMVAEKFTGGGVRVGFGAVGSRPAERGGRGAGPSRPSSGSCCTTPTTTPRRACCKRGPTTRARRWTGGRTAVPRRTSLCGSSPAARSLARTTGICRRAIRPSSP